MGFWNLLREIFLFEWLFGSPEQGCKPVKRTHKFTPFERDCNCGQNYYPPRNSSYNQDTWSDDHYACEEYYHDSQDDYAHDFDDFDDDY